MKRLTPKATATPRCNGSCFTNLLSAASMVTKAIDKGSDANLCFLDFGKVYNVANHRILCTKLLALGVSDHLITWIRNFLVDRTLQVLIGHAHAFLQTKISEEIFSFVPSLMVFSTRCTKIASFLHTFRGNPFLAPPASICKTHTTVYSNQTTTTKHHIWIHHLSLAFCYKQSFQCCSWIMKGYSKNV